MPKLGVDVRYVPATDYTASVEMFKSGDVHRVVRWPHRRAGQKAVAGARAIAQGVEDPNYKSYFIANSATGLTKSDAFPEGIKSLRFTFGSQASTGRLMPEHFIRENTDKDSSMDVRDTFSGAHDKTARLVASGAVDAGVLSYKTYDKMVADGRIDAAQAPIIWETPPYADYNFTAHPDLETKFGDGFTDKLAATLIAIKDPELLGAFPLLRIIAAKNSGTSTTSSRSLSRWGCWATSDEDRCHRGAGCEPAPGSTPGPLRGWCDRAGLRDGGAGGTERIEARPVCCVSWGACWSREGRTVSPGHARWIPSPRLLVARHRRRWDSSTRIIRPRFRPIGYCRMSSRARWVARASGPRSDQSGCPARRRSRLLMRSLERVGIGEKLFADINPLGWSASAGRDGARAVPAAAGHAGG